MGFRFRKRFSFGKFFRLNVSGSGLSAGLGPPGANINIGPRGTRTTFGIPGTGLSWVKTSSWKGAAAQSAPVLPLQPPPGIARPETPTSGTGTGSRLLIWIAVITLMAAVIWLASRSTPKTNDALPNPNAATRVSPLPPPVSSVDPTWQKSQPLVAPSVERAPAVVPVAPQPDALNINEIRELQQLLNKNGYDTGPVDGIVGPKTQAAIARYVLEHSLPSGRSSMREVLTSLTRAP